MAEVTKSTRTVTTTEETFTLTLSTEERSYLLGLLAPQPSSGPGSALYNALLFPANGDTYEYKGVTYDLTAEYLDTSSDAWHFTGGRGEDGVPLMSCQAGEEGYENWPLSRVADQYLTLRKI